MPEKSEDRPTSEELIDRAKESAQPADEAPTASEVEEPGTPDVPDWDTMETDLQQAVPPVDSSTEVTASPSPVSREPPAGSWPFRQSKAAVWTAAFLLLVSTIYAVVITATTGLSGAGGIPTLIIDVVLAVGLFGGKSWARIWTLIRAVGGLIFVAATVLPEGAYSQVVLQAGYSIAIALLLLLVPSSTRKIAGSLVVFVAAVAVSVWLGGSPIPSSLEVGDCFALPAGLGVGQDVIVSFPKVSCSEPHDGEVVGVVSFSAGSSATYPGDEPALLQALSICRPEYEEYLGVGAGVKLIDLSVYSPVKSSWDLGDREIICAAQRITGEKLTSSVRGKGPQTSNACIDGSLETGTIVDCSLRHIFEVFAVVSLPDPPGSTYPTDAARLAEEACLLQFQAFVLTSYEDSVFELTSFYPLPETWKFEDRQVTCVLGRFDGRAMTGSAEGSGS